MPTTKHLLPSPSPDLDYLLERVRTLRMNSKGTLTRSGYRRDFEHYRNFCLIRGLVAVPASESTICLYLAHCSTRLRVATIARRMAAIADGLKSSGHDATSLRSFLVQETWKGIKRTLGVATHGRAPLLASAIREIAMACPDTLLGRRDRSLILTGYCGGFRRSELGSLQLKDLSTHEGNIVIHLKRSKNDPEAKGRTVVLVPGERKEFCPVHAMREWIDAACLTKGAIYRGVDRYGNVSACLNPDSIPRILKRAAARAGFPSSDVARIAAHSLRAGLVTQSSLNGVSPLTVAEITGHRTLSVVKRYCRVAEAIGAATKLASSL
jgi:site-specific recombinase XerD